jgi:hypothetical protein
MAASAEMAGSSASQLISLNGLSVAKAAYRWLAAAINGGESVMQRNQSAG